MLACLVRETSARVPFVLAIHGWSPPRNLKHHPKTQILRAKAPHVQPRGFTVCDSYAILLYAPKNTITYIHLCTSPGPASFVCASDMHPSPEGSDSLAPLPCPGCTSLLCILHKIPINGAMQVCLSALPFDDGR